MALAKAIPRHLRWVRGAWLFGIAQNVLRESVRRQAVESRGRRKLGLPVEFADDDGYVEVDERLSTPATTLAALAALPPDQRRAIELRVLDELGYEEIAERLGIRPAAVRLRVSRGRRTLAAKLEGEKTCP